MSGVIDDIGKVIAESLVPKAAQTAAPLARPPIAAPGVVTPPLSQRFSVFEPPAFPEEMTLMDPSTLVLNAELARATQELQDQLRASIDAQAMHRMSQGFLAAKAGMMSALQPVPLQEDTSMERTAPQALPAETGSAVLTQIQALRDTAGADHERIAHVMGFDHRPMLFEQPATPASAMLLRLAPWAHGVALEAQRVGVDIDKALAGAPVGDGSPEATAPIAMMRTKILADLATQKDPGAAVGPPKSLIDIPPELQKSAPVAFPPARPIMLPDPGTTTAEHAPTATELQSGGPQANVRQQNVLAQLSGWQGVPDAARIQFARTDRLRMTDSQEIPVDIDNEGRLIAHVPSPSHMNETIPVELVGGDLARAGLSSDLEPFLVPGEHAPVALAYDPTTNRVHVDKEWTQKREWLQQVYNRSDRADIQTADTNPISAILTTLRLENPDPSFVGLLDRHIAEMAERAPGLLTEARREAGAGAQDWEIDREHAKLLREHSLVTAGLEAAKAVTMRRVQLTQGEPDPIYNPDPGIEKPTNELLYEGGGFSKTTVRPDYVFPWNTLKPYEGTDDLPLVEVAKRILHPDPINSRQNPKGAMRRLVRVLTDETARSLEKNPSGADWYRGQLAMMDDVLRRHIFPDASEIEHAMFRLPLAVTSIGQTVGMNFELATHALEQFRATGKWPVKGPHQDRWPGPRARTIMWLMERLDFLHRTHFGGDGASMIAFMLQQHTNTDLRTLAEELRKSTPSKVGPSIGGKATDLNYGARIFGPKVGAFMLNMYGVPDAVTIDAWATRTMRRVLGMGKQEWDHFAERYRMDDSMSGADRRMLQQAITIAAKSNGISPMDTQALLWVHEKELWAYSGSQAESPEGFGDVAQRFVSHTPTERAEAMAAPVLRSTGGYIPWSGDAAPGGGQRGSERLRELAGLYRKLAGIAQSGPAPVHVKPVQPGATTVTAVHYSSKPGLTELNPEMAGTGARGSQVRRFGMGQHGLQGGLSARTYFYVREGAELPVAGRSVPTENAYSVELDNLYDLRTDPRGLLQDPLNTTNQDRLEEAVSAAGFDGFISAPAPGMSSPFAVMFDLGGAMIPVTRAQGPVVPSAQIDVQVGMAYEDMVHNPSDPEVALAYAAFKAETARQFAVLVSAGYRFEFATADSFYKSSEEAIADVIGNKRILIFPTHLREGFGGFGRTPIHPDHPLLEPFPQTGFTYNDVFRGVHDIFGHAQVGTDFSHAGEIGAWLEHQKMYSPLAQRALDTETVGQECWQSARPATLDGGEFIRPPMAEDQSLLLNQDYAEQKAALLPAELMSAVRAFYTAGTPTGMLEVPGLTLRTPTSRYPTNVRQPLSERAQARLQELAALGPVKWKGGIGTFAMGINPDALPILKDGMIDIRNKVIRNPRDLAQVMQAFRHTYEIHHLVAVGESGKIHAHYAATSRLPDRTRISPRPPKDLTDFLTSWLQRVQEGAGEPIGFYSVHNHPSGEVVPSKDDHAGVNYFAQIFQHHYRGALIIDSNKYAEMSPDGTTYTVDFEPAEDELLTPSVSHPVLAQPVMRNSTHVARAFAHITHAPKDYVTVLLVTTRATARGGFYVPEKFMLDPAFEGWLVNRMRETGGSQAFLRIPSGAGSPLWMKARELMDRGPVIDVQMGDMPNGYDPSRFMRATHPGQKVGLQLEAHEQSGVMRSPQTPYQPSLERAQALAHLASGQSFSSKPKLFEALTDDEKFHAIQVRISQGYVSRSLNHLKNINPSKWATSTAPKYFGTWKPTPTQLTTLQGLYDKRVVQLQATWALEDKLRAQVAAKNKAGIPAGRKTKVTERVPLEDFLRFDPHEIDTLLKDEPGTYSELVRQFFSHYESIEDELDNFGEPMARELGLAKLDMLRDMFHQGALELKDSGPHPASIPRSVLSGMQRRLLSTKQNIAAIRSITRLLGRPMGVLGVRKQLPHPIERIAAHESGELDQSLFNPIYEGALRAHTDFNQTAREFMPLSEAAGKSEDLDRAIFAALELRLDDRELQRPEWNGFKIRRPGTALPTTINLKDWIPKLRDKYDQLIKDVETSKIRQARMRIAQDKYDVLVIEAELRRRELEAAQEEDPTITDWDTVDPKTQAAVRKALKKEDNGDHTSTDFVYLHGGLQGYTGPAPMNIGGRGYQSLTTRHRTAVKRVEANNAEIQAIEGGSLRRSGYVTHSYALVREAVRNDMKDPYSVSYRYVHPTVRNHYLDERLSEKEPFKSWAVNWFLYLHKMHETAYLEPELKKASQQLLKVPDDQRVYMQHWLLRLQDVDAPLDRTLNRVQYNAMMEEPGTIDRVYQAMTGKPFKDVVSTAKDNGELSHRGWSNLTEAWKTLTMTSLLSPVRIGRLNLTEASFMLFELSKRPHVDLPMGMIWGLTGALQTGLEGTGEFLSWLGSHTGLMERYYSRPSKLGVSDSLDDIQEHRRQLMHGHEQTGTDKLAQQMLKYRGMIIRATEFINRATAFHVKEKQYKFYGATDEFAAHEAAKDVLDMWGAYGKRDTSPVASSQLWKQWWSLKRFTSAKSGNLATGLMGASEAVRRGLGVISPERFGIVQPSAEAGDQGMLPPPPPPPPAHKDSAVGDFSDPAEQAELDWMLRSPAPFGAAFPAGPDASLRHLYSVMAGLPLTVLALYFLGSMVVEKYRRVSSMRIWDNVDPWQWNNIGEVPGFFWNKDLSLLLRYTAYGELFGRTAQEQQQMEKSMQNLLYKFPILGAIIFEQQMNAKEAQRNSMAPAPPSAPKLPGIPGEIRGRRLVKRGILQRVSGWLKKQQAGEPEEKTQ